MRFSGSDAAVSAAVLLGACGLLYLFAADLGRETLRTGEKSLGSVVFKKLSATRKAPAGLGWERMRNNSPVYEADTLRTAGFSEAAVYFDDGTNLDILENSMLKLDFGGPKKNLEFLSGEISVGGSGKDSSYTISSAAGTVLVAKDSKATFSRSADSLRVEVSKGAASIVRRDGSSQAIAKNQELEVSLKSGETKLVRRPIVPILPERNARLLSLDGGRAPLEFAWEREAEDAAASGQGGASGASLAAAPGAEPYTLELSGSKGFEAPALILRGKGNKAALGLSVGKGAAADSTLPDGTWYWRVRDAEGRTSPPRKFSLRRAQPPLPAIPAEGQEFAYRRVKPAVRFAWTGMDEASAYLFELASEPSFAKPAIRSRSSTMGLSVDSLEEGTWYWRVKPIHAYDLLGAEAEAPVRKLVVRKSPAMGAPAATTPFEGSLFQVQELDGKGLAFSWIPESEAASYRLLISRTSDLSAPIASFDSAAPFLRLTGADCEAIKKPGAYYWGLRWIDREGNASPPSPARSLSGVDGSIALRLSFPPEGYRIADSLAANTRFAWKTNVPARTVFQLARDADFKDIAYQETVAAETLIGHAWKSGAYYWRLRAYNTDGSVFLETKPRGFEIVDPFEGPPLLKPSPGSAFYLREHDRQELSWKPLDKADYYSFKLYSSADSYASPILERSFLADSKLVVDLGDLPTASYKASVQGFAAAKDDSTRVIGYIGDSAFDYKRITYIKLKDPADRSSISGLAMRRSGYRFAFEAVDRPESGELIVSSDKAGERVILRSALRPEGPIVKGLAPGGYYWTVKGELAGFDISAKERFRFDVSAIPPLPRAELLSPARGFEFGPAELRASRSIQFSWKPVPGATHYGLMVYASGRDEPLLRAQMLKSASYSIADLSILEKGDYGWKVVAYAYDDSGELEQSGLEASSAFSIKLPALKKAKAGGDGTVYGR